MDIDKMHQTADNKEYTFVFDDIKEDMGVETSNFRRTIWQIFPSLCASMLCVPFGIMLGWPSPTYPYLINRPEIIEISSNESAMIAGFLMIGNTVATPFSSCRRFAAKYGIVAGVVCMVAGWIVMWQARGIGWLLVSRLLVGMGHGYGNGQVKIYISEICQGNLTPLLIKQLNLYVFFGVVLAFSIGPFVDFRQFNLIAVIVTILTLFLAVFLPSTPRELLKNDKVDEAKRLIQFLSPQVDANEEIFKVRQAINAPVDELTLLGLLRDDILRRNFVVFSCLVFFQQMCGAPATVIYSQTLLQKSGVPHEEYCALIYSLVFFLANVYGIFCAPLLNKKYLLIFSSFGVSLMMVLQLVTLFEKLSETLWGYTSLLVMLVYIVVHSVGLGNIPFAMIPDLFPSNANRVMVHFFVMIHSMLALIITKVFQVMCFSIDIFVPFCLFFTVSTFGLVFIIIFVPNKKK